MPATEVPGPGPHSPGSRPQRHRESAGASAGRELRRAQGERQLYSAREGLGVREEGGCVHPDEVPDGAAFPFRGSAGTAESADVQGPGAAACVGVGGSVWSVEEQCKVLEATGLSVLTSPLSGSGGVSTRLSHPS